MSYYLFCILIVFNKVVKNGSLNLFADDTMMVVKDSNVNNAIQKINEDLDRIYNWLNTKKLMLNIDKTKWMLLAKGKIPNNLSDVKIANSTIERVSQMKGKEQLKHKCSDVIRLFIIRFRSE